MEKCVVKHAMVPLMIMAWSVWAWGQQAQPNMMGGMNDEEAKNAMAQIWKEAGTMYSDLFLNGPNVKAYLTLGEHYFTDSKPIHSRFYYALALALEPENERAQKGWEQAQKQVDYLTERFSMFSEKAAKEGEVTSFGSMAAIRFHLGFHRESFDILHQARIQFGDDMRIAPLQQSFIQELEMQSQAVSVLFREFEMAMAEKQSKRAREALGQIVFITKGNPQVIGMLAELTKIFPDMNQESAQLLEEFTKLYPNQKS